MPAPCDGVADRSPTTLADHLRPQPLEVACGLVLDGESHAPRLRREGGLPRSAIEGTIRRALLRPPCLVSFSGGRDSSAVLATATAVARREGLPLPVPVTHRFPGAPASREDRWQDDLVGHLGLADWERITVCDELDSVGPVAQAVLRRHGVLWPFNAHLHVPLLERAAGGSLLTGVGGDELFGRSRWWVAQRVLAGRVRPRPRHLRTLGLALSPYPLRREYLIRRHEITWPWLHPQIATVAGRRRAAFQARAPLRWSAGVDWWWRSRARSVLSESLQLLAADCDTQLVQPFLAPSVLEATARQFGVHGPVDRTTAMRAVFGDVLPEALLSRRSKARFDDAFFCDHSRAFVAAWTGAGVNRSLVDVDRLAEVWHAPRADPRSFSLLQAAWLAEENASTRRQGARWSARQEIPPPRAP